MTLKCATSRKAYMNAYMNAYMKVYRQSSEYKARHKALMNAYRQSPEYMAKERKRYQSPEYKAYRRAYRQSPEYKAYQQSPEYKAYMKVYLKAWRQNKKSEKNLTALERDFFQIASGLISKVEKLKGESDEQGRVSDSGRRRKRPVHVDGREAKVRAGESNLRNG